MIGQKYIFAIIVFLILAGGISGYFLYKNQTNKPNGIVCTMDAKLCPDGSYVSRTGANCEFAECPAPLTSGIRGKVLLGPTCPVERIPPDPRCADKEYAITLGATSVNSSQIIKHFSSGADGSFKVDLPPGTYNIVSAVENSLPRCGTPEAITVIANQYSYVTVFCDTGIR